MKNTPFILSILTIFITLSCETEYYENNNSPFESAIENKTELLISKTDTIISKEDAVKVAKLFSNHQANRTKSHITREVEDIMEVRGTNENELLYAINFKNNNGYILISSTKKHFPILAFSDEGKFTYIPDANGSSIFIRDYLEVIGYKSKLKSDHVKEELKSWHRYEVKNSPIQSQTKDSDPLTSLIGSSMSQWINEGYDVYPITESYIDGLPEDVLSNFQTIAETTSNPNYDYQTSCFILEIDETTDNITNCQMSTAWVQTDGINEHYQEFTGFTDVNIGCGAIAIGQIINYHDKFLLDEEIENATLDNFQSDTLDKFLAIVAQRINVNHTTGESDINSVQALLNTLQYHSRIGTHSNNLIFSSLAYYGPIYMTGFETPTSTIGHAWVCDGWHRYVSNRYFVLMTLSESEPLEFVEAYRYGPVNVGDYKFLHMNWGISTATNGWYSETASVCGYNYDRQNIYEIKPNY